MASHHGKNGAIYSDLGTGPALLAHVSDWTLDMTMATVETTAMGAANKTYVVGLKDVKGTIAAFWDDTDDSFFNAVDSPTGVLLSLYPDLAGHPAKFFAGPAWLSGSIKAAVSAAVTLSGNFVANGAWTRS
jgi:hypothetical protein